MFLAAKMNESDVTCDAVISAVQTLLTPTQFSVFGKNPKVGCPHCCTAVNNLIVDVHIILYGCLQCASSLVQMQSVTFSIIVCAMIDPLCLNVVHALFRWACKIFMNVACRDVKNMFFCA